MAESVSLAQFSSSVFHNLPSAISTIVGMALEFRVVGGPYLMELFTNLYQGKAVSSDRVSEAEARDVVRSR